MKALLLCLCLTAASATAWHPVHTTQAEVDWNRPDGTLEIALHLTPRDLETALTLHAGASVRLDKTDDLDAKTMAWLTENLELRNAKGKKALLTWVGMETDLRDVWLYFQFEGVDSMRDWKMHNRLLQRVAEDYVSTMQLRLEGRAPYSLRFDRKTESLPLLAD